MWDLENFHVPRVVRRRRHEDIRLPNRLADRLEQLRDPLLVRHRPREPVELGLGKGLRELCSRLLHHVLAPSDQNHLRGTGRGKGLDNRAADARPAARHK